MAETVGVAIVSYNSKAHLPRALAALERQTFANWRLVVVDNASRAEERPDPRSLPARGTLIQLETNTGFAAANNTAAAALGAIDFLACLNPDAFPEPDWLARLLEAAGRWPRAAAFGALQVSAADPTRLDGAGDELHAAGAPYRSFHGARRRPLPAEAETFSPCAAAALYRKSAFDAVGGFDADFFSYCEDVDLGYRLRLAGWTCVQVNAAIVAHVGGASAGRGSAFATFHGMRNRAWLIAKNTPGALLPLVLPLHLALTAALLLAHAVHGQGGSAWRGWVQALAALPRVRAQRRLIQRGRRASLAAIAAALAWSPLLLLTRAPRKRPSRAREG